MVKVFGQKKTNELSILIRLLVSLALIALLLGVWSWWHFIKSEPKRVFWNAIDNALQTSSFSRETIETQNTQKTDQKLYVNTSPKAIAQGTNEVTQTGVNPFRVVTSEAGNPTSDFVKYDYVKTSQPTSSGKPADFTSVLNIWGKDVSPNKSVTSGQLYNQSVLGVLPFGRLNIDDRRQLIKLIKDKNVMKVDYNTVSRTIAHGRPTYTFSVSVNAEAYIGMLKQYADSVGLTQLKQTNPADYRDTPALSFKFTIDVWTQQITKVSYVNGLRNEFYGSYGLRTTPTDLPKNAIDINELQQRVRALE
ncbi:MAG TPA: hypothetical protein VLF39_02030 [Candidatus Saccharimonadales bacterium]|nr:hypothetical protein [Candidatus Saccharimonadales bacterium]